MSENGILSYGAYVPRHRLQRAEIAAALGAGAPPAFASARSVACYDEDTTTMGVEAARRAGGSPSAIYFATTAPAYLDKANASAIHAALDLGHEGFAVDMVGSARSAVGALRAAAASGGLAVLSDIRTGRPQSADERDGGDGAAAFVFGTGDDVIAELVATASVTAEFLDRWRRPGSDASGQWEERFGQEMYEPLIAEVVKQAGVASPDHVVISSPHTRTAAAAGKRYGAGPAPALGYAGAADLGLKLADVLDRAEPGQTILLISAADGADALVLRTTENLAANRAADPVAAQFKDGRDIAYATYLTWRGVIEREPPRRPEPDRSAGPPSARAEAWKFGFVGSQCEACGFVHVPPIRVCKSCREVDRMARIPLANSKGKVATYTVDRLAFSPSPSLIVVVVDFEGGGRYTVEMTDTSPEDVEIGTEVEMTFRRLYTSADGVHNYFWKAKARG